MATNSPAWPWTMPCRRAWSGATHVDEYDVFLIQARGCRHWRWSGNFDPRLRDDTELSVLAAFEAEDEFIAEPGDLLYLPPGVAHHGIAETESLTVSVGLRAPSTAELLAALAGWIEQRDDNPRYADPDRVRRPRPDRLDGADAARLRQLLRAAVDLDEDTLLHWFGAFVTEYRLAEDLLPAQPETAAANADTMLQRAPAARLAWSGEGHGATLMANGESRSCEAAAADFICRRERFRVSELDACANDPGDLARWLLEARAFTQ